MSENLKTGLFVLAAVVLGAAAFLSVPTLREPELFDDQGQEFFPAFGGARGRSDVPRFVDWYMSGKIAIDELITEQLPLERINDAFTAMHEGRGVRTVIRY